MQYSLHRPSPVRIASLAVLVGLGSPFVGVASAEDLCNVAEADRQPIEALQAKLESQGWQIRNIKVDDGCYEAYALDQSGEKVEVYFDPATFDVVKEM